MNNVMDKDGYNTFLAEVKDRIRKAQYEALNALKTCILYRNDQKLQPLVAEISWIKNL